MNEMTSFVISRLPGGEFVQWLPVNLAPRDGTPVLLYCPAAPPADRQFVAMWRSNLGAHGDRSVADEWCEAATGLPGLDEPHSPALFAILPNSDGNETTGRSGWPMTTMAGPWMPISGAPRDGTAVLVYCPDMPRAGAVFAARWEDTEGTAAYRAAGTEWCEVATGLPGVDGPFAPTLFALLPPEPESD